MLEKIPPRLHRENYSNDTIIILKSGVYNKATYPFPFLFPVKSYGLLNCGALLLGVRPNILDISSLTVRFCLFACSFLPLFLGKLDVVASPLPGWDVPWIALESAQRTCSFSSKPRSNLLPLSGVFESAIFRSVEHVSKYGVSVKNEGFRCRKIAETRIVAKVFLDLDTWHLNGG